MSDTPRSAADKATEFLYLHNSLCRSQHLHHRAMLTDNCERGSAQKAATFDADDLSALMQDFAALERELADERSARQSSVTALEAIRVDAEQRSEKAQKELYRQNVKLGRELAEARKELAQQYTLRAKYADTVEAALRRAEQAEAALAAERQRHAEAVERLEAWARSNNEERQAGKVPTFLNPHTVLLWLGQTNAESEARREP